MRPETVLWVSCCLLLGDAAFAGAGELGAHRHGHGSVNLVIEGATVWIELKAPGADIVGFEHAAETAAERAAVESARALLERPLELVALPAEAGCSVVSAAVAFAGQGGADGEGHSEVDAEYRLACNDSGRIDAVRFPYFDRFPAARELVVKLIAGDWQAGFDVDRAAPVIRLGDR